MDSKEQLKSMLHNLINDKTADAEVTLHDYIVRKTREVSGFATANQEVPDAPRRGRDE